MVNSVFVSLWSSINLPLKNHDGGRVGKKTYHGMVRAILEPRSTLDKFEQKHSTTAIMKIISIIRI